jgi:uncharacterized protein (TIGR02266 family)
MMTENAEKPEERSDPKFKAQIAIFNGQDQHKIMTNYSVNMSTGGVFIETVNFLPVDTLLIVKFKLPENDLPITCKARVSWTNEPGNLRKYSLSPGMGLQFIDLSLNDMHAIRDYLINGKLVPTW